MADREYITPGPKGEYGNISNHGYRYLQRLSEWVNNFATKLTGLDTSWDDLRVSLSTAKLPAADYPGWGQIKDNGSGSVGVFGYHFGDGEYVFLTTQLPHSYKEGSTIYPHIHFMTTTDVSPTDKFGIGLEYLWSDISDTLATTTTVVTREVETGVNTAYDHQLADIPAAGIAGTGMGISSIFMCRLYRYAATGDNYAGDIVITDFDIHFEKDTWGSTEITSK